MMKKAIELIKKYGKESFIQYCIDCVNAEIDSCKYGFENEEGVKNFAEYVRFYNMCIVFANDPLDHYLKDIEGIVSEVIEWSKLAEEYEE